ncbi:hypothetical protein [Nocardioides plantarum]|uniref:Uncharacterized protein n=1 Tax=Nocardioides plantarum TaxID=29299 RepID=A0ABV5KCQ9_9ACTN|nr:hypothetical protein [Nocardioides plantarum]
MSSPRAGATTWQAPSPGIAIIPGVLLTFVGLWMLTDGGPLPLSWFVTAAGQAFLLIGAVAKGVAWGLALHRIDVDRG